MSPSSRYNPRTAYRQASTRTGLAVHLPDRPVRDEDAVTKELHQGLAHGLTLDVVLEVRLEHVLHGLGCDLTIAPCHQPITEREHQRKQKAQERGTETKADKINK